MEYGLSLALGGALVHAKEVDYGLPKEFQIVCPACREPIFKVGSTLQNGNTSRTTDDTAALSFLDVVTALSDVKK